MKKIVSMFLAILMCLGIAAYAEDLDLSGIDTTVPATMEIDKSTLALHDESKAAASTDVVVVTDSAISVTSNGVMIYFDVVSAGGGYMCLTQDIHASLASYLCYEDPYAIQATLLESGIKLLAMDLFTTDCYYVFFLEPDGLSTLVGDMKALSTSNQNAVAGKLSSNGVIEVYGGQPWVNVDNRILVTIINSQYVAVQVDSDTVAFDVPGFMSALSVYAAE